MTKTDNTPLTVRADVELFPETLKTIVENVKNSVGRNDKGYYKVDTAAKLGEMISMFLRENDFDAFVRNPENYSK